MKHTNIHRSKRFFTPLIQSASLQAATMFLKPGDSSSNEPENEHPRAEQWLYVISGNGRAKVARRSISLRPGSLLLIEKHEKHQITNNGHEPMLTLNFYAPPAYTRSGEVTASAK